MAVSNPFIEFYSEITLIRELAYANSQDRYFLKNLVVVSSKPKEVKLEVPPEVLIPNELMLMRSIQAQIGNIAKSK